MKNIQKWTLLCCLLSSTAFSQEPLARGGISSGGGFLVNDATNPWFLENTKVVNYCIDRDDETFHADENTIDQAIVESLGAWKKAFSDAAARQWDPRYDTPDVVPYNIIRIATQNFEKQETCEGVDLRFQLGKLNSPQRAQLVNPNQYIAATFRTSYDEVNLRGAGFIYLAADEGDLRPSSPHFHDQPWMLRNGAVLRGVIAHELGHIFGVPHASMGDFVINSEVFPFVITDKRIVKQSAPGYLSSLDQSSRNIGIFGFELAEPLTTCFPSPVKAYYLSHGYIFGSNIEEKCVQFREVSGANADEGDIAVFAANQAIGPWRPIGEFTNRRSMHSMLSDTGRLLLTDRQKVFSKILAPFNIFSTVEMIQNRRINMDYRRHDGSLVPVELELFPNRELSISTMIDNQIKSSRFRQVQN